MPNEIIVPRLGWSMEEGAFVAWLKKDGELVKAGEPLFSIEGDKAVQEIESIDSGILRIAANGPKPGDSIRVGDILGHLLATNETAPQPVTIKPGAVAAEPTPVAPPIPTGRLPVVHSRAQPTLNPTRVSSISPRAVRVAAELGIDWSTVTGTGRTGRIRERDIRAAASSRKASCASTQ